MQTSNAGWGAAPSCPRYGPGGGFTPIALSSMHALRSGPDRYKPVQTRLAGTCNSILTTRESSEDGLSGGQVTPCDYHYKPVSCCLLYRVPQWGKLMEKCTVDPTLTFTRAQRKQLCLCSMRVCVCVCLCVCLCVCTGGRVTASAAARKKKGRCVYVYVCMQSIL